MNQHLIPCIVLLSALCSAQTLTWTEMKPYAYPSRRVDHSMVYDSARQRVVLFGGYPSKTNVLWEWDGKNWTQVRPATSPAGRWRHAMAYDAFRRRVVLFGGYVPSAPFHRSDTWEWDGKAWTLIKPATSPAARHLHAMVYDAARQRVVLFGGSNGSGSLADTWEWDGKKWIPQLVSTFPSAREQHAMAYDAARRRVVLFGGSSGGSETWEWNGKAWAQMKPTASPSARQSHAMAYDAARRRVVLFGGSRHLNDTWEWDGKAWTRIKTATSPSGRERHAVAYDFARQRVVFFGGTNAVVSQRDTWEYGIGSVTSRATPYGATCGATLAAATNSRPIIGTTFTTRSTGLATTTKIGLMTVGASKTLYRGFPLPLGLDFLGMKGCFLHTSFDATFGFSVSSGTGSFAFNVPNSPVLLKSKAYLQAAAGAKTTNGLEIVVGDR